MEPETRSSRHEKKPKANSPHLFLVLMIGAIVIFFAGIMITFVLRTDGVIREAPESTISRVESESKAASEAAANTEMSADEKTSNIVE